APGFVIAFCCCRVPTVVGLRLQGLWVLLLEVVLRLRLPALGPQDRRFYHLWGENRRGVIAVGIAGLDESRNECGCVALQAQHLRSALCVAVVTIIVRVAYV